jgi:hypothetical protein
MKPKEIQFYLLDKNNTRSTAYCVDVEVNTSIAMFYELVIAKYKEQYPDIADGQLSLHENTENKPAILDIPSAITLSKTASLLVCTGNKSC